MQAQPLADKAADRQPAKGNVRDAQMIEQSDNILAKSVNPETAAGKRGCAMAVTVISKYAETLGEGRYLRVPHGKIGAQRIRQHKHRQFLRAVETIVKLGAFHRCKGHMFLALRFLEPTDRTKL